MNKFLIVVSLLFCTPVLLIGQQQLKAKEISFVFESKEVQGSIGDFRSESTISTDDISQSVFEGSVSTSSLKTGNFLRDWALKSRKYFNEDQYPRIHFKSTAVSGNTQEIQVEGLLTLKGKTKPLTIYFKRRNGQLVGTAELYTSDYGVQIKKIRAENKVHIRFAFVLEE
ncbi:MAG: YceI family protein [Flavobacteriaceae bacterium]|nr:YceI family protein [Eudoraea sp.]NNJ38013.1 YceI family protein [Flavobacteriaceae bacterium]